VSFRCKLGDRGFQPLQNGRELFSLLIGHSYLIYFYFFKKEKKRKEVIVYIYLC